MARTAQRLVLSRANARTGEKSVALKRVAEFRRLVLGWAEKNGRQHLPWRRKAASTYQKLVAETLLQRTRAETVALFFAAFVRKFPSWKSLAHTNESELKNFLRPIGLWRRRSASLKRLAQQLAIRGGRFPRTREEIEALAGVGQYIANAVLTICHGERQPLLDVNMARVLERYFGPRNLADLRYDPYLQRLAAEVVDVEDCLSVNWAILDFAASVCKTRGPLCASCPVFQGCAFARPSLIERCRTNAKRSR